MEQSNALMLHIAQPEVEHDDFGEAQPSPFIEANTVPTTLEHIKQFQVIPTFRDSEPLISHAEFIEATQQVVFDFFHGEIVMKPSIRQSHMIQGRIPEAKDKPAHLLTERERTVFYERLAFTIEVPSIQSNVGGHNLSLTVGGVKAYNLDNFYNRKGVDEHFKVFIGFQNKVCTNMCVWTDGYLSDLKVKSVAQLKAAIYGLVQGYESAYHLDALQAFNEYQLSEHQFATIIGRARMYQHLPAPFKKEIPPLLFGDNQISTVCKDYFRDKSFCREKDGNISLWKLYNLFTGANKSSYIDNFLDRSVNAFSFTEQITHALQGREASWYLN